MQLKKAKKSVILKTRGYFILAGTVAPVSLKEIM